MAKKDWMIIESELDEDQIKVLMATNEKSCIVSGCAGSGKSVLALIKAQRIQNEKGPNYKIIVYTKALCGYMNAGKNFLGLTNDFLFYNEWKWKKCLKHYNNGSSFMVYEKDNNNNKIPYMPSADYIIVDEIQDFAKEEIQEFIKATNKHCFFFGDTAQSLYSGFKDTLPVEKIPRLFDEDNEPKIWELYRNYRLPKPVAKIVRYVGVNLDGFDISTYKSEETAIPRFIQYSDFKTQIKAIKNILERQIDISDVGILIPTNENVKHVSTLLNDFGVNHELKYDDKKNWHNSVDTLNFSTTNPKVMTYHSAKGLQFETVFLPGISELSLDPERHISDQKALYVAMTRTYRNLYIMYSNYLPEPLSDISPELYKTTETDTVEDI